MASRPPAGEIRRFLKRLPLSILAAVAIWAIVRPAYNTVICATAQGVARAFENPRAALITPEGDYAFLSRTDLRADSSRLKTSLTQVHFNLVPFLALVFALPGSLRGGGWKRGLAALGVMAASHVLALIWQLKYLYAFSLGPWSTANYSDFARNVYGFLRYFFDLPVTFTLPLLAWVAAFPHRVLPLVGLEEAAAEPPRKPRKR